MIKNKGKDNVVRIDMLQRSWKMIEYSSRNWHLKFSLLIFFFENDIFDKSLKKLWLERYMIKNKINIIIQRFICLKDHRNWLSTARETAFEISKYKKQKNKKNKNDEICWRPNRENSTLRIPRAEILVDGSPPA